MTQTPSEPRLSRLLQAVSKLVSGHGTAAETVESIAETITADLNGSSVSIALRTRSQRAIATSLQAGNLSDGMMPFVVFSRPVVLRGWEYGRFQVWLADASTPPVATLQALETLTQLLGLLAEKASLSEHQDQLRRQLETMRLELEHEKLITRAAGIVSAVKGISQQQAARWIESEARRTRRPVLVVADRIVLERTSHGLRTPQPAEPALGRTA